jgi:uncharacterized membrane protein YqjE
MRDRPRDGKMVDPYHPGQYGALHESPRWWKLIDILRSVPVVLYFLVGIICFFMAFKSLSSKKFLPFHEQAAGKPWNEIDDPLKLVILSFLRLSGLGFLIVSILLLVFPIVNYIAPNIFYEYSIPVIALIYCMGLFIVNYLLYKNSRADTPWKGSLYAFSIIVVGIVVSLLY